MLLKLEYPQPHGLSHSSFNRASACEFCLEALAQWEGRVRVADSHVSSLWLCIPLGQAWGCPNLGGLGDLGHPIKQQSKIYCVNMLNMF